MLYPWLQSNVFIIIASSILIDTDHVYLLIKQKDFSWKNIKYLNDNIHDLYKKDSKGAFLDIVYIFHTIEFNTLLLFLAKWQPVLHYIVAGFLFHILCDVIHHKKEGIPILRWLFLTHFLHINKNK